MSRRRAPARRTQPASGPFWLIVTVVVVLLIKYLEVH